MMNYFPVTNAITSTTRRIQHEGRDTIVAPVILMVEGVHNGSSGPLYYPREELQASAQYWNGMPLPIHHPTDSTGAPISCNSPEVIESHSVGRLWNVVYEERPVPRLKGEIYVDVAKARAINNDVLDALTMNHPLEVSTGLYSNDENAPGNWNGEQYIAIVRDIRGDHLALLPGGRGACSFQKGCGVRNNKDCYKYNDDQGEFMTETPSSCSGRRSRTVPAARGSSRPRQCASACSSASRSMPGQRSGPSSAGARREAKPFFFTKGKKGSEGGKRGEKGVCPGHWTKYERCPNETSGPGRDKPRRVTGSTVEEMSGSPIKGCPSRAKRFTMQEKGKKRGQSLQIPNWAT